MRTAIGAGLVLGLSLLLSGCEKGINQVNFNHTPPVGQGSLVVNNNTATRVDLFVDAVFVIQVHETTFEVQDLTPGVHRVVLTEHKGSRSFSSDVDVLQGRLTVLDVTISGGGLNAYQVLLRYE